MIIKFQKKLTSGFYVFADTGHRDAGQNPGATKIPIPQLYGRGIKMVDIISKITMTKYHYLSRVDRYTYTSIQ